MKNPTNIVALGKNVLVEPDPDGVTSSIIDTSAQDKAYDQESGTLLDIGELAFQDWSVRPRVGDKVYFMKYKGCLTKDKKYRLFDYSIVLGCEFK